MSVREPLDTATTYPPGLNRPVDYCCNHVAGCGHHIDGHGLGENCYVPGCPCTAWRDHVGCNHRDYTMPNYAPDPVSALRHAVAAIRGLIQTAQLLDDHDEAVPSDLLATLHSTLEPIKRLIPSGHPVTHILPHLRMQDQSEPEKPEPTWMTVIDYAPTAANLLDTKLREAAAHTIRRRDGDAAQMTEPTLYTRFTGWWCDGCRIAADHPDCPGCDGEHAAMRAAVITIEPRDIPGDPDPARIKVQRG